MPWRRRIPIDSELLVTILSGVEVLLQLVLLPIVVLLRMVRILPWEIVVRDDGARRARSAVETVRVRGWRASAAQMDALASDIGARYVDPAAPGFPVVITRDSVCMGDDTMDNTEILELDDRTAEPTLWTLLAVIQARGRFVSIVGASTTWALRESGPRRHRGRPLAILVLHADRHEVDVHPVADTSFRVAKGGHFHLEYLLTQSVQRTRELIAEDRSGKHSLRESRRPA